MGIYDFPSQSQTASKFKGQSSFLVTREFWNAEQICVPGVLTPKRTELEERIPLHFLLHVSHTQCGEGLREPGVLSEVPMLLESSVCL